MRGDLQAREGRAHRRVDTRVRPRHVHTAGLEKPGERAHPRPADRDEVNLARFRGSDHQPEKKASMM